MQQNGLLMSDYTHEDWIGHCDEFADDILKHLVGLDVPKYTPYYQLQQNLIAAAKAYKESADELESIKDDG